jgi:hypothetical protein
MVLLCSINGYADMLEDLLSKYSNEAERQAYLLQLVKDHPYFIPAQFYLLQGTPVQDAGYIQRATTTALLYNNTGWLNYQLHHHGKAAKPPVTNNAAPEPAVTLQTAATDDTGETTNPEGTADTANLMESIAASETADNTNEAVAEEIPAQITTFTDTITATEPLAVQDITTDDDINEAADTEIKTGAAPEAATAATNNMEMTEKKKETAGALPPIPLPGKANDTELLFEPLYAVDYFASQGIKLSEELQSGDKLGKQLKSFTEWLKSMKKTHTQSTETPATPGSDPTIQYIAEKSNKEDEVLTEAMATVYARQGSIKKAIDIYQKLSLLNPSKSAYFAAKIENLK